jgi:hypothetical protein
MKLLQLSLWFALVASVALADDLFPGLQKVLTPAEWQRAGLDKLTPDQIGVIDAALIKHYMRTTTTAAAAPPISSPPMPAEGATPAEIAVAKSRFWEKFGLGKTSSSPDWRTRPPMTAKVTAWRGVNGFVLDNGQVWEGVEKIPFDLPGNTVIIEARPMDTYALKLHEDSAAVRVRRVR